MLNDMKIEVSLTPPGTDEVQGLIFYESGMLNFDSHRSVSLSIHPTRLTLVSIRTEKFKHRNYSIMYVGFGNTCSMTWLFYGDPKPLFDFFEEIRVELDCEWEVSISEKNHTENLDSSD